MSAPQAPVTVVIADDEPDVLLMLRATVGLDNSFEIIGEALDGLETIAVCEEMQPDVVMLDALMPGMTGLDAIPEIRRVAPRTKVLVFSASSTRGQALAAGADRFVNKSVSIEDIFTALRECLR